MSDSELRYLGTVQVPLFKAPYTIPADFLSEVSNAVSFSAQSPAATINTLFNGGDSSHAPYWDCLFIQPFDYGRTKYTPTAKGSGGVTPVSYSIGLGGPASVIFTAKAGTWNGFTGDPATGTVIGSALALTGGLTGVNNVQYPAQLMASFTNGFSQAPPNAPEEPHFWQIQNFQIWSIFGPAILYSGWSVSSSSFIIASGESFNLAGWGDTTANLGLATVGSNSMLYFPPVSAYPSGRWFPWSAWSLNSGIVPSGGAMPFTILLGSDKAAYEDAFNSGRAVMCSRDWLIGISLQGNGLQAFTPVLISPEGFYLLELCPMTADAELAISDANSISFTQDEFGTFYLVNNKAATRGMIFHSFSLNLQGFNIALNPPTPFVLPCFNPCVPNISIPE